jgi:kynurenine formamidase
MIIELTREIRDDTKVFPGSPLPKFITWTKMDVHQYHSEVIFMSTHTGTHMDAPSHFVNDFSSIDKIAVNRFISNAILIRIKKGLDQLITKSDIMASNVKIGQADSIVFSTSWEDEINNDDYFSHSPGLSEDAANYLTEKKVNAVCIDSPSIDRGIDSNFPAHKILLTNQVLVVENLCNLEKVHDQYFTLILMPLKLSGASGSPVRAVAVDRKFGNIE